MKMRMYVDCEKPTTADASLVDSMRRLCGPNVTLIDYEVASVNGGCRLVLRFYFKGEVTEAAAVCKEPLPHVSFLQEFFLKVRLSTRLQTKRHDEYLRFANYLGKR